MAISDVTISKRGGGSPIVVTMNDVRVSWEVSVAGLLSGGVAISVLEAVGLPTYDLRGYWLDWEHPQLGRWSGIITATTVMHDRVLQITAETHHVQFKKKFQGAAGGPTANPAKKKPGLLFAQMFNEVAALGGLHLTKGIIENGHQDVQVEWLLSDYYDTVIPALTSNIDYEWDVTPDRVVHYRRRIGSDKRGSVRIAEGVEIAGYSWMDDLWQITNRLLGIGTRKAVTVRSEGKGKKKKWYRHTNYGITANYSVPDQPSIDYFGILASYIDMGYMQTQAMMNHYVTQELKRVARPPATVVLETVPTGTYWTNIREGDIIRIVLGSSGIEADFRVIARAYDTVSGILVLSGEGYIAGYQLIPNMYIPGLFGEQPDDPPKKRIKKGKKKKKRNRNRKKKGGNNRGGGTKKKKKKGRR